MLTDRACLSIGCDYSQDDLIESCTDEAIKECPKCHERTYVRIASAPSRIIFK